MKMKTNRRGQEAVNVDRISALPDALICHILSFLSTKESAATSILSTRWKYLFASRPNINLEFLPTYWPQVEKSVIRSRDSRRFLRFLKLGCRILQLRDGAPIAELKLSLYWVDDEFRSLIDLFISSALGGFKVQELEIFVMTRPYAITCPGIFTCKSLVCLKLLVDSGVPDAVCLPNLKVLEMKLKGLISGLVHRLIQGCPLLEELCLDLDFKCLEDEDNKDAEVEVVDFSSPSIKTLRIRVWSLRSEPRIVVESNVLESLDYFVYNCNGEHQAIFNVPNLKEFSYFAPAVGVSFIRNLDSLLVARIGVGWPDNQLTSHDAINHLVMVQSVKSLSLEVHVLEVLYDFQDFLPNFKNLTSLELLPCSCIGEIDHILAWKTLPNLLEKTPNLEVLIFNMVTLDNLNEHKEFECLFLEALPICFIKNLKEIEIKNFRKEEQECELKLIEYLLRNGNGLKKMIVGPFLMPSVCKRILSSKRSSEDCEIVLDEAKRYHGTFADYLE